MIRIAELVAKPWDIELTEPFGIAGGAQHRASNALVTVTLDDGIQGIGEAAPFPAVNSETQASALAAAGPAALALVGATCADWRAVAARLKEAIPHAPSMLAGIESAVLDAVCRQKRSSLLDFFGGSEKQLSTDITIPTGSVEHARRSARRAAAEGFRILKIKVGGTESGRDVRRLQAILDAAPETKLVLDANASLTADEAIALVDALGEKKAHIALFEQPTPAHDLDSLRRVRLAGIRVAADESVRSLDDAIAIAHAGAADVLNIKIMKCGVAESFDIASSAKKSGLGLMVGGMVESKLAMGVSACLAAGMGGFAYVDLDTPMFMKNAPTRGGWKQKGRLIELDASAHGHGVTVLEIDA